jgi:hypothetical protein
MKGPWNLRSAIALPASDLLPRESGEAVMGKVQNGFEIKCSNWHKERYTRIMGNMVTRLTLRLAPFLPIRSIAWAILGCTAIGLLAFPTRVYSQDIPGGVYCLNNSDRPSSDTVLDNPDIVGVSIRCSWSSIEPTEGNYDWTFLDSEVSRATDAGKNVLLRIMTQSAKPQWVTDAVTAAGGLFFTFNDGSGTKIPVFWDPTFLAKKKDMIAALGAHFGNNPTVKIVCASFANASSEDWSVPHGPEDVVEWLALGYTPEKMLAAGKQIIDATMVAFPNALVTMAIGQNGHINGLNLDPDEDYVARNAILVARTSWPNRFIVQKNSVSAIIPEPPGIDTSYGLLFDSQPMVAGQMLYWCFTDTTYRMNGGVPANAATVLHNAIDLGVGYGMKYLEIYQLDCVNLPDQITYAKNQLANPPPTPTPTPSPPAAPTGLHIVK